MATGPSWMGLPVGEGEFIHCRISTCRAHPMDPWFMRVPPRSGDPCASRLSLPANIVERARHHPVPESRSRFRREQRLEEKQSKQHPRPMSVRVAAGGKVVTRMVTAIAIAPTRAKPTPAFHPPRPARNPVG